MTTSHVQPQRLVQFAAATMLAIEIAIHVALAPGHLHEIPYVGTLFVAASVLLAIVLIAVVITPADAWEWQLGTSLCLAMAAAFVVSRLFGLPGFHEAWSSDGGLGLMSLPPEAVFILCAARRGDYSGSS